MPRIGEKLKISADKAVYIDQRLPNMAAVLNLS